MARDYSGLTREQIEKRLNAAEDVAVMWSWGPAGDNDRDRAAFRLWQEWLALGGSSDPAYSPHLTEERISRLAAERAEAERRTMAALNALVGNDPA